MRGSDLKIEFYDILFSWEFDDLIAQNSNRNVFRAFEIDLI